MELHFLYRVKALACYIHKHDEDAQDKYYQAGKHFHIGWKTITLCHLQLLNIISSSSFK